MKKYLEIEIVEKSNRGTTICIAKQTHRRSEFGNVSREEWSPQSKDSFFSQSQNLWIMSVTRPEWRKSEDILFVRGSAEDMDNYSMKVSSEVDLQRIIRAVEEYNMEFGSISRIGLLENNLFEI